MPQESAGIAERQRWMAVLAKAKAGEVEALWPGAVADMPAYRRLRGPEIGLAMVRGRVGGTGNPFNLGEMTVTRCAVQLADGSIGHAYVGGRRPRQAELAAVADALLQDATRRPALLQQLIAPLAAAAAERHRVAAEKAAATKVEFFTVAREAGR
ncbi:MAG TPA: phosphonate C-P lyase system protein PhnG [Candidatus Sulfotelmatobacter sp.]|nr:phosphonate C-P lyase system protein PhnG [Candidatus Sulfotelmatobacter sp.]